jgi:hypothetical protein
MVPKVVEKNMLAQMLKLKVGAARPELNRGA